VLAKIDARLVLALRLAVLFYRHRTAIDLPPPQLKAEPARFRLALDRHWLERNPLTAATLSDEVREWEKVGFDLRVPGLPQAPDMSIPLAAE